MSEDNEATSEETEAPQEPSEEAGTEFSPFDELHQNFNPGPPLQVTAVDGLPVQVSSDGGGESDIPELSPRTLVCMGDFSSFVTRNGFGEVTREFSPAQVEQKPNGSWYSAATPDYEVEGPLAEVFPIRPPCKHYVRQMGTFEHNPQHQAVYRLCSARRTTEGTFMSVRDTAILACDMRVPRDLASEELLNDFDNRKVGEGANRVSLSIFSNTTKESGK